jgi:hypothetical protein
MKHCCRAAKHLAHDTRLPKWVKWLGAFGLLPIPFILDELALIVVAVVCVLCYRQLVHEAWLDTAANV